MAEACITEARMLEILTPEVVDRLKVIANQAKLDFLELQTTYMRAYNSIHLGEPNKRILAMLIVMDIACKQGDIKAADLSSVEKLKLMDAKIELLQKRVKVLEETVKNIIVKEKKHGT